MHRVSPGCSSLVRGDGIQKHHIETSEHYDNCSMPSLLHLTLAVAAAAPANTRTWRLGLRLLESLTGFPGSYPLLAAAMRILLSCAHSERAPVLLIATQAHTYPRFWDWVGYVCKALSRPPTDRGVPTPHLTPRMYPRSLHPLEAYVSCHPSPQVLNTASES